jgi:hypothetical protein
VLSDRTRQRAVS